MTSWVETANTAETHFPLQNLPYGVSRHRDGQPRCAVAIGDFVLDLSALESAGLIDAGGKDPIFNQPALNGFMALGPGAWKNVRRRLIDILSQDGDPALKDNAALRASALIPMNDAKIHLPFKISEYTDFYASKNHATNVGTLFRGPDNALPPNWLHMPIGYNGRASTVVISGTPVRRPLGQIKPPNADMPSFGPCKRLDIELELGAVIGQANAMGQPVSVAEADAMIFGYVLLNDWSARDIQAWEYQPLGPFQGKAFATSISPWIVTKAALEPFRTSTPAREKELLSYLQEPGPMLYDIELETSMQPQGAPAPTILSRTNYNAMYYSSAQQLAHHTSGGCAMTIGDLLGSGTISGAGKDQLGSLLEMSNGGKDFVTLADGARRTFIEDGDTLTLTGWAQAKSHRIGFGECTGTILPAIGT